MVLLVGILAALVALWRYSKAHDGIDLVTSNHYTWTYGPTAIFILVISYWRLVDYHFKALAPWVELAGGPSTADRSILLDYMSPLLAITFTNAARRGHFAVCMSIVGFLLLKIATIASSGLFLPTVVNVGPFDQQMAKTSQFDEKTNFTNFTDPGASPFYQAYAVMQLGLSLPHGLTEDLLYETYTPVQNTSFASSTYKVRSRAFVPKVTCDEVDIKPLIDFDEFGSTVIQYEDLQVQNTSDWTCPNRTGGSSRVDLAIEVIDVASRLTPPQQLLASWGQFACKSSSEPGKNAAEPFLVAISDVRYSQTFNSSTSLSNVAIGDMVEPETWQFSIPKITGMICGIDYEIRNVDLLYNMSLLESGNPVQQVDVLDAADTSKLSNLALKYLVGKLGYAAPQTTGGARDMFGLFSWFQDTGEPPNTAVTMAAKYSHANYDFLLNNPTTFRSNMEIVMKSMLLQIAKDSLVVSDTNSTFQPGQSLALEYHTAERLLVQTAPFAVVFACILVVLFTTAAIFVLWPKSYMSINPETLAAKVDTLSGSRSLEATLQIAASLSENGGAKVLRQSVYQSDVASSSILTYQPYGEVVASDPAQGIPTTSKDAYAPFTLSKFCIVFTLVSAPVAIAVLEVLQHLSDSGVTGIATIEDDNSTTVSIYTRFLPALVALLIATMYNCLDFNTAMLAPFNHLAKENGRYDEFKTPILAHVAPLAIFRAFRRRYWAACLTGLGALVGSILTIVVSGLFTVQHVPQSSDLTVLSRSTWNLSFVQGDQPDNGATALSSVVESANLSFPQFTYDQLVFPSFEAGSEGNGTLRATLPALRADLVCKELPWSTSNMSYQASSYKGVSTGTAINFNITVPLPDTCHSGSCHGNESFIRPYISSTVPGNTSSPKYWAQAVDLHTGPWHADDEDCDIFFSAYGIVDRTDQPVNQPGCPSLLLAYGFFVDDIAKSTFTSMVCEQRTQQVDTSLQVSLPATEIVSGTIPVPDETTAKYLENGDQGEKTFGWWAASNMEWSYVVFNKSAIDPAVMTSSSDQSVSTGDSDFSNFFRGAFLGRTPLTLETMQKNDTESKALIMDHIQLFYRRYMAQYFSANLRVNTTTSSIAKRADNIVSMPQVTGSFTPESGVARLVQHRTPKIVLQAMLSFMFVCAVLALLLGKYHGLVLWNPCTIAGSMVLFAGSKMVDSSASTSSAAQRAANASRDDAGHEMTNFSHSLARATGRDWRDETASFRLGWWRDGNYMGFRNVPIEKGGSWRYGIDVVDRGNSSNYMGRQQ